jgi:crotonobetainyl-CoA:carnitine CoA-transferase CaiB-like acyl-CoA transferase
LALKTRSKFAYPLSGIKVLDFTEVLSGPYCTQILADLGAEVIKVEPPWGDGTRRWGPFSCGDSAYFLSLNRNKKSIAIDLSGRKEAGRNAVLRLAQKCDVLVESYRPGVMSSKLKLGYEEIKKVNPSIIYCSISGYGQEGPLSRKPAYDLAAFAASGIMSITGEEKGSPVKVGVPVADLGAAMSAALAISVALFQRQRESVGAYIDVSLYDTMISWLSFQAASFFATGRNPKRMGSAHPILVPYQAFKAKDRYFILGVGNDAMWQRACEAMKLEKLSKDKKFGTGILRVRHREELTRMLTVNFRKKKAKYWLRLFEKAGVPCDSIRSVKEALESEHTKQRNLILKISRKSGEAINVLASPFHFDKFGNSKSHNTFPPVLGEHSVSILKEFGFSKQEIRNLIAEKVVLAKEQNI